MTRNFNIEEFNCNGNIKGCDCKMPDEVYNNVLELAENLQIVRDMLDEPIKINSGWRCENYNRQIGGVSKSQHIKGKAADITIKNLTPDQVANAIDKLQNGDFIKKGGLGRYNTFTHIDIRGKNSRWDNRD